MNMIRRCSEVQDVDGFFRIEKKVGLLQTGHFALVCFLEYLETMGECGTFRLVWFEKP